MASSLYNLALDFSKELNYTKAIMARQGDKGITVTVKPYLNGLQMDTSGGTFTLKGTTPSNRYVDSVATSVTSEEVTFSLDGTFMSEAGYYKHCYVEYRKDNQILTTQDIIFFSLGVSDISQGQADEYVSQLEELIRKYNETFDAFMAETKGRVDSLNQQITDLTGQAKTLQDKLDALKEEISKLGNLQVMYSNSIDFGDYDYLGRPNLMKNVTNNSWTADGAMKVTAIDDYLELVKDTAGRYGNATIYNIPSLRSSSQYTTSLEFYIKSGTSAEDLKKCNIAIEATNTSGQVYYGVIYMSEVTKIDEWVNLSNTFTTNTYTDKLTNWKFRVYIASDVVVSMRIRNTIKIEKGSTATPYQPNLLDAPYYLSKVALGKNIANKSVKFPINASTYPLYSADMQEPFIVGQTYTLTIKATKPSTQQFRAYNDGDTPLGYFAPVEGLTDVWSCNFIPTKVSTTSPKLLSIYQVPNTTLGACQIDWLKIEKGGTRTPNIQQYKYFGEGLKDSNDPNDYSWDITPEYAEKSLNNTVSLTEPQTVLGLKNFSDGIQISGDHVVGENEHTIYKLDKSNSNSFIDGYATFIKHGKIVIVNGTVKFKKAYAFGVPLDDEVPEEFIARGVNGMIIGASGTSNSAKMIYVRQDFKSIMTNSEFAINEWFTFNGVYWVGEE
ncbi:BppU family phage baseplate upper protein [Enterococcus durans]|uniref:BppU family phage baseplate upper protein n=1 Tax=Enterococcus durans TaxID=53345 RepID=UPI00189F281C|nr:BppU family phage baseplate upper protein [Enterococcus durans]